MCLLQPDTKAATSEKEEEERMPSGHFNAPEAQAEGEGLAWESLFCEGNELLRWWEIVERVPAFGKPCSTQGCQGQ